MMTSRTPSIRARKRAMAACLVPAVLLIGSGLGGCNTRQNEMIESNRALTSRNQDLVSEIESLRAANAQLTASIDSRDRATSELRDLVSNLRAENLRLRDQLAQFNDVLTGIKFGALDPETDRALRELAAQYPDLITYDADRGMVRFTSDLLFASGSAEVTENARQSLEALARVLQSPATQAYDVRIVGHTDAQRISPGTAQRHPTNWHLSAHRAIGVMNALTSMGVPPQRVEVAGRGEFMPAVPNTGRGNTPQNRRVEIFLVRGTGSAGANASGATAPAPAPAVPAPAPSPRNEDDFVK